MIEGRDLQERSRPRELREREDEGHSLPGRWVNSHELRAGDCIISRSGTRALITEIRQHFEPAFLVSNLTIFGQHNYSVGDVGVLVHNVSVCDGTIADLRKLRADGMSEDKINDWLRSKTDDNGNRLYNDDEIEKALGRILAPNSKFADHVFGDASKLPCFPAETLVHTAKGLRPIQSIEDGDQVLAYDEQQNCVVERSVTSCLRNWTQQLVKVQFDDELVMATRTHPFYSLSDSKWVSAHGVTPGMILLGKDLQPRSVLSVETVATEEPTYNIEVDGLHNYFVGEAGVLVHNSGFEDLTKSKVEIYIVRDASGKVVYIGQTVQGIDLRFNQHIGKGHPHWKNGYTSELARGGNWTKFEAAVWERHFIDQHGGMSALENIKTPITEAKYNQFKHLHDPC